MSPSSVITRLRVDAARRERGTITPLIIGFVAVVVLLIIAVSNVSRVFVYQRDIEAAADAAALAAANGIAVESVYGGGLGSDVELSEAAAEAEVANYLSSTGATGRLNINSTDVTVSSGATDVTVSFAGSIQLPFVGILGDAFDGGNVPVTGEATATVVATQ